jgi:hypothetical protein
MTLVTRIERRLEGNLLVSRMNSATQTVRKVRPATRPKRTSGSPAVASRAALIRARPLTARHHRFSVVPSEVTEPWVKRDEVLAAGGACTHALMVGVSAYDYLTDAPAARNLPPGETFRLGQLRSAAASAWSFARWLADNYKPPDAPVATIRLLLSPSADEEAQVPGLKDRGPAVKPATRENVEDAVFAWRADCDKRQEDVAVLYAAGHGAMLSKDEGGLVLLQDFGQPNRPMIANSLDVPSVRRGLAGPTTAQQQFFFIDACAVRPEVAREMQAVRGGVGLDEVAEAPPASVSAIYASAAPGTLAFGDPGKGTLFSQALIECFGGTATSLDDAGRWVVTDTSLVGPLRTRVMELAADHEAEQVPTAGGTMGNVVMHELAAPPTLDISLSVEPNEAAPFCFATLDDGEGETVLQRSPLDPPLSATVPAGLYTLAVVIDPPDSGPYKARQRPCYLRPPKPAPVVVSVS